MKKLAEMREARPMKLHGGVMSTTTDVWAMLDAARTDDLSVIKNLASKCEALLWCQYDYTTPMQFAVREGHFDVVSFLVENGGLDREDRNHPFLESLPMLAEDRHQKEIADYLKASHQNSDLNNARGDTGKIEYGYDEEQVRFQDLVDKGNHNEADVMLRNRPDLALDELAFWGEGIMATAANGADRRMLELLLDFGARVPNLSKWGARYYFKHYEIGKFLLEQGMTRNT